MFFHEVAGIIREVAQLADRQGVQAVLCGGMAVQMYGYVRATKDIDFIADRPLQALLKVGSLSFGGDVYNVRLGSIETTVDWILRADERKIIYDAAVLEARIIDGIRVITPEWLVIVKIAANRTKDEEDINFLLSQPQLVDRDLIRRHYRQLFNGASFGYLDHFDNLCLFADFSRARDQRDGAIH